MTPKDAMLLALKMEEGATSQEMQGRQLQKLGKARTQILLYSLQKRKQACLDFSLARPTPGF